MKVRLILMVLSLIVVTPSFAQSTWQTEQLTDVRTGEMFSLADFEGKTVFVETMATWCVNCRRQLSNVAEAKAQVDAQGNEDIVFVAISVETNLAQESLQAYSETNGFDWHFAVATPELLRSLVDDFGRTITVPPSTPHVIIYPDGTVSDVITGIEPAGALLEQLGL
ncbi:MAG: redoxin family protein [Deinococcota bacterium]